MYIALQPLQTVHARGHNDRSHIPVMTASVVVPQIPGVCMSLVDRRVVCVDLSLELKNHDSATYQQDSIRSAQFHRQLVFEDGRARPDRLVHLHGLSYFLLE